jgi:tetratricopeptide (TPR) repeat protein
MTLPISDPDGAATMAAAEGESALIAGDTPRARQKFAEAGGILEKKIQNTRKTTDKHLLRFLAATQYYKGGHYKKSLSQCQRIQRDLLPDAMRPVFQSFDRDVRARASEGYVEQIRNRLLGFIGKKDAQRILEILQEHPYVYDAGALAFVRATACEELRQYRAATVFYADAIRRHGNDKRLAYLAAALPLNLPQEGRIDEAWEYTQYQMEIIPNPLAYVNASLLSFYQSSEATGQLREVWSRRQIEYFDQGWELYEQLSDKDKQYEPVASLIALGLESIPFAYLRLGDKVGAKRLCDRAVAFRVNSPNPYTVRGIVTYPSTEAVDDFRTAIRFHDPSYFPYYHLAQHFIQNSDFERGMEYCQLALSHHPSTPIESQLYDWLGVCFFEMRKPETEAEWFFRKALDVYPENVEASVNYRYFKDHTNAKAAPAPRSWKFSKVTQANEEEYVTARKKEVPIRNLAMEVQEEMVGSFN